jgi:hypothetical protein
MNRPRGLSVSLPPELRLALQKAAQADERTASSFVRAVLVAELRNRGLYSTPKAAPETCESK